MRLIIGRLTAANWVAHLVLILAAAAAAAGLASAEGDMLRKVITVFLIVLVLMLIAQVPVEQRPPRDGSAMDSLTPYAQLHRYSCSLALP
ncbi:MAG TPA: hypothetical protein VK516_10750 [Gemmatimonadaceae bacterium]|nr:hypothetical protein [Gemmatimonadaceae bacterium]